MKHKLPIVIAALALAHGSDARADARQDVENQLHTDMERLNSARVDDLKEYGKCRATLKKAKKLKKGATFKSMNFEKHPAAKQLGSDWTITVADIPWMCDAIDLLIARGDLWSQLTDAKRYQETLASNPPPAETAKIGEGEYHRTRAKACVAGLAKEVKNGATAIEWKSESIPVDDARGLCDVLSQWADYIDQSGEANFEKVAPKYRALGVDGDRLRLFVQYDGVSFRGKKCEIIESEEALAKAKYVYHWLENADGTHTIRKYTFKKNTYKVSEKTYLTEKKAYKGCK